MPHAVTWFDISSNDPENLAAFYKKAFKWKIDPTMGMMIQAEKDGDQQGIAGSLSEAEGGTGGVLVYVTCPDIDAHLEKVKAAGGTPLMPKTDLPGDMGSIATFSDPDGNRVGLWAPVARAKSKKAGKKAAKKAAKADKKAAKKADKAAQKAEVSAKKAAKKPGKKAKKKGKKPKK